MVEHGKVCRTARLHAAVKIGKAQGVSVIIRTASGRLAPASVTIVRTSLSAVQMLPAKAVRSGILATPSSKMTRWPFSRLPRMLSPCVCPAPRMASVTSTSRCGPMCL